MHRASKGTVLRSRDLCIRGKAEGTGTEEEEPGAGRGTHDTARKPAASPEKRKKQARRNRTKHEAKEGEPLPGVFAPGESFFEAATWTPR